ncbi:hypothetical protein KI387_012487, partial [Taxus chinensis]
RTHERTQMTSRKEDVSDLTVMKKLKEMMKELKGLRERTWSVSHDSRVYSITYTLWWRGIQHAVLLETSGATLGDAAAYTTGVGAQQPTVHRETALHSAGLLWLL